MMAMPHSRNVPESLFDRMDRTDRTVLENARFVQIDERRIPAFSEALPPVPESSLLDADHHYLNPGDREGSLAFLFALEAVNFGGTWSSILASEGMDLPDGLYLSTARRLKERFSTATLNAAEMIRMTSDSTAALFGFQMGRSNNARMARMYADALRQTGTHICQHFSGKFQEVVNAARGSVESFVEIMRQIPRFNDTYTYPLLNPNGEEVEVPILKNAQHLAGSLSVAVPRLNLSEPFSDTEKLTAFPDNKIAHVLWVDGILKFSDDLEERIKEGTPIPVGSPEEIEIRIGGRHAVRLITAFANTRGPTPLRQIDIDHRIWHASHRESILMTGHLYRATPCFRTAEMTCHY